MMKQFQLIDVDIGRELLETLLSTIKAQAGPMEDAYVKHTDNLFDPSPARRLLGAMLASVEEACGRELAPEVTFARVYRRGAVLLPHADRAGLDWTVSIVLEADEPWALKADIGGETQTLTSITLTQGVLCNGGEVTHWRDEPYEGESCIVLLLHYRELHAPVSASPQPPTVHYRHVSQVLNSDELARIYRELDGGSLSPGMVTHGGTPSNIRANMISWLPRPEWQWLYDRLWAAASRENDRTWRLPITVQSQDEMQFTRYAPGEYYGWHRDVDEAAQGQIALRALSVVVLLRDPAAGGGLELRNGGLIEMAPGDAAIFPASEEHRALQVTAGTRDSLILWLSRP